jgi:hypothetical protein
VRTELYRAFEAMEEVLEQDLDAQERQGVDARLRFVAENTRRAEYIRLANSLRHFLFSEEVALAPRRPGLVDRWRTRWQATEQGWLNQGRMRAILAGGLAGLGLITLAKTGVALALLALVSLAVAPDSSLPFPTAAALREFIDSFQISASGGFFRYTDLALETLVGVLLLFSAGLLMARQDHLGTAFGYAGLLLSLTAVNLLVFYYDQFSSVLTALMQLVLLVAIAYYRQRFVYRPAARADAPGRPASEAGPGSPG